MLVVGFAWGYDEVRSLHGNVVAEATAHGNAVLHIDSVLHLSWAAPFNAWLSHHATLAVSCSAYYFVMHLGATSLTLLVLWLDGVRYRWHRNALAVASVVGLVVYWVYPVAPPRLLPGFRDVVQAHLPAAYDLESAKGNLYAAVPSLHMTWALWCAVALWSVSRRPWVRAVAVGHVALTALTVLATANHYTFDLLTGAALVAVAYPLLHLAQSQLDQRRVAQQQPLAAHLTAEVDLGLRGLGGAAHRHHPAETERVVRHAVAGRQRQNRPQPGPGDPATADRPVGRDLRRRLVGRPRPLHELGRDVVEET